MQVVLSELLTTEYVLSTPFNGWLGRVPVVVYAVLDNTVVLQIIGEDDKRVVRHDFIKVDPETLWARATPMLDQLQKSRAKGRANSRKRYEKNGTEPEHVIEEIYEASIEDEEDQIGWPEYDPLAKLASVAESVSG